LQTKYLFAESLGVFGGSLAFTALGLLLGLGGDPLTLALLAALPYLALPFDLLSGLLLDRLDAGPSSSRASGSGPGSCSC